MATPRTVAQVGSRPPRRSRLVALDVPPTPLLTVRQVADRLGVCAATVYALCAHGELPHARVLNAIRVAPADLEAFLEEQRRGGRR